MILILLGLAVWSGAHLFPQLAPALHERLGPRARPVVAAAVLASVVLMVLGYSTWDAHWYWTPPPGLRHVNNLLMLIAVYLFAASGAKTRLAVRLRHPQLIAVILWATAHLLVNGHLAAPLLFGGLGLWAILEILILNARAPAPVQQPPVPLRKEAVAVIMSLVVFILIGLVHGWIGPNPFGGTS